MSATQLDELISRYHRLLQQGQTVDAADLCQAHPELGRQIDPIGRMERLAGPATLPVDDAPAVPPAPLVTIPGYEVLGELGRGGMGVVYKARQVGLNRVVALKMILGGANAGELVDRFRREAEVVARLRHP